MSPLILSWRKSTLKLLVSIWPPFPLRQETLSFLCRSHYYVYVLVHSVLPLWYLPNNWGERESRGHTSYSSSSSSYHKCSPGLSTTAAAPLFDPKRSVPSCPCFFLHWWTRVLPFFPQAFSTSFASADFFSRWRAPSLRCKVQNARFQSRENSDPFWDHLSMCVTSFYLVAYPISQSHLCVNADTQKTHQKYNILKRIQIRNFPVRLPLIMRGPDFFSWRNKNRFFFFDYWMGVVGVFVWRIFLSESSRAPPSLPL